MKRFGTCRPQGTTPLGGDCPKLLTRERPTLTARRAVFLLLRRPEKLEPDEQQVVQRLAEQPELATAVELAQRFTNLVRQRQPEQLDAWLERAKHSHFAPMVRFAQSLREGGRCGQSRSVPIHQ